MTTTVQKTDDNCIKLRIDKWSQLPDEGISSKTKDYFGFPWKLRVDKHDEKLEFILFIYKEEDSNLWFCEASMEVSIVNQNKGGANHVICNGKKRRFSFDDNDEGLLLVLDKPSLLDDPKLGFFKDGAIIVEARIKVYSKDGSRFRNKIEFDLFSPSHKSDGILIVEGEKVHVSKQFLSIHSPFFDRIFFGKFKDATELETEIQEVKLDELEVLLKILYRTGESFDASNVEYVLKLADRFEMLSLIDDAEKYLLSSNGPIIHTKLRLADQYNLIVLQDHVLPMYTADLIRDLNKSSDFGMLKEETKDILLQKYIKFTSPK